MGSISIGQPEIKLDQCSLVQDLPLVHSFLLLVRHCHMRVTRSNSEYLCPQISVQGLLSLLLAMYGILHIAGDFKEIRANVQLQNK